MPETILLIAVVIVPVSLLVGVSLGFWMGRHTVNLPVSMIPRAFQGTTRYEPEEDPYEKAMRSEEEGRIPTVEENE